MKNVLKRRPFYVRVIRVRKKFANIADTKNVNWKEGWKKNMFSSIQS